MVEVSTETVGLLGTGAKDVHLDFHTAPELCVIMCECVLSLLCMTVRLVSPPSMVVSHWGVMCVSKEHLSRLGGPSSNPSVLLYVHRDHKNWQLGTGSPDGHLDFHTAPARSSAGLSECWVLLFWIQCRLPLFWLPYIFVPRRSIAERRQWWVGRGRWRPPGPRHHDFHIDPNIRQSFWRDHSRLIRSQGSPAYHHVHQHARPTSFRSSWNRRLPTLHLRCCSFGTGGSSCGNLRLYQILSCTKRICCHHASHSITMSSADWSC